MVKKSENFQKSQKFTFFIKKKKNCFQKKEEKKCYTLSFPILGGRDSTQALQSSLLQKYKDLKKSQKFTFFFKFFLYFLIFFLPKKTKCYPLGFPIFGGRNSTRALQFSLFQKYENLKKSQKIYFFSTKKL